jgi:transposase
MPGATRFVGLDVHKHYVMVAAVDSGQHVVLEPQRVGLERLPRWIHQHLSRADQVALEATSNAWLLYDALAPQVADVKVANPHQIQLISHARVKTDRQAAIVLAKLSAANLLPEVWVPPVEVRQLRSLVAHRQQLTRNRTAAKNRLHSVLHRHNILLPQGDPFSAANAGWWQTLPLSSPERLRMRHDLLHIQQLSQMLQETKAEIAPLSVQPPWADQVAFLIQLPGIGLQSAMTILSAIGQISRFPHADQLVSYSGLAASVHASGQSYRTGAITKQGRRELRTVLVECAWAAVRYSPYWKAVFDSLTVRLGKHKAIVAVARKLLVVVWHVLTKRAADRHADPQAVARSFMKWVSEGRLATSLAVSRATFAWRELARIGLNLSLDGFSYCSRTYPRPSPAISP